MPYDVDQGIGLYRFHEVIHHPLAEHLGSIVQIGTIRQHDDWYGRPICEELHDRILSVFRLYLPVTQDNIYGTLSLLGSHRLGPFLRIVNFDNVVTLSIQCLPDNLPC